MLYKVYKVNFKKLMNIFYLLAGSFVVICLTMMSSKSVLKVLCLILDIERSTEFLK